MSRASQSARVHRRRLQARAFSRHHRRAAADRILRGSRRELHGRRRAAARAARRVARTLCAVGAWRRAVDRLDAAARPRPSRAAQDAVRSLRAGEFLRTSRLVVARRRLLERPAAAALYAKQTLARVAEHVDEVQTALGRQMLLENPSTYIRFSESTIPEVDFLAEVSKRTGCGLLLDINNVFVSARNHATQPLPYLDSFPLDRVKEIHLGGHHEEADDAGAPLLIDSHGIADRRSGLDALCACHRPHRGASDPDRMGQRRSRLADAARRSGRGTGHSFRARHAPRRHERSHARIVRDIVRGCAAERRSAGS